MILQVPDVKYLNVCTLFRLAQNIFLTVHNGRISVDRQVVVLFIYVGGKNGSNITSSGIKVHDHAMVVRPYEDISGRPMNSMDQVQLAPLLHLQR